MFGVEALGTVREVGTGVEQRVFGDRARRAPEEAKHLLAHREALHALAERGDEARAIHAGDVGELEAPCPKRARELLQVKRVQRGGTHPHEHLLRARHWLVCLAEHQLRGRSEAVDEQRLHRAHSTATPQERQRTIVA